MNNKKQKIQIIVIVVAFAGAGLVLYNGLFKKASQPQPALLAGTTTPGIASSGTSGIGVPGTATPGVVAGGTAAPAVSSLDASQDILPYGGVLDFNQAILPGRFQYNIVQYPKLDPATDVGTAQDNLIITTKPGQ